MACFLSADGKINFLIELNQQIRRMMDAQQNNDYEHGAFYKSIVELPTVASLRDKLFQKIKSNFPAVAEFSPSLKEKKLFVLIEIYNQLIDNILDVQAELFSMPQFFDQIKNKLVSKQPKLFPGKSDIDALMQRHRNTFGCRAMLTVFFTQPKSGSFLGKFGFFASAEKEPLLTVKSVSDETIMKYTNGTFSSTEALIDVGSFDNIIDLQANSGSQHLHAALLS